MHGRIEHHVVAITFIIFACVSGAAGEEGLVGHWTFDEGQGSMARDASGNNHHGRIAGAQYVKRGEGFALKFDGRDDYVDCGLDPGRAITSSGTIELWYKPERLHGGLVSWRLGGHPWTDARLVLTLYEPRNWLLCAVSDGVSYGKYHYALPEIGTWNHITVTFDGTTLVTYENGVPARTHMQRASPKLDGLRLKMGRGLGFYTGLMDDVRIYNRALARDCDSDSGPSGDITGSPERSEGIGLCPRKRLSGDTIRFASSASRRIPATSCHCLNRPAREDILAHYKAQVPAMGRDTSLFERPQLRVKAYAEPGWIAVEANHWLMHPLPEGAELAVELRRPGAEEEVAPGRRDAVDRTLRWTTAKLDARHLPAGSYDVFAAITARGRPCGKPATARVSWPGQSPDFKNVKVLNNLVWQLLSESSVRVAQPRTYSFVQPKTRWVFIEAVVDKPGENSLRVTLDGKVITLSKNGNGVLETMRFLPAGAHQLRLQTERECRVSKLVVRSIPEILYSIYGRKCHVPQWGPYDDLAYLERHILKNVNTLVFGWTGTVPESFGKQWKQRGGRWLVKCGVVRGTKEKPLSAATALTHLQGRRGFKDPLSDGVIADEFGNSEPFCAYYAAALRKLKADPQYGGKVFYPYVNSLYTGREGREFAAAIVDTGSKLMWKRYLKTLSNEERTRRFVKAQLVVLTHKYRKLCPGSIENTTVVLGHFSIPSEFLNTNPAADYKVHLDTQFNLVATDPVFRGTYGLNSYVNAYTDEETARWVMKLFRHYGIEGRTEKATNDRYFPGHLTNPDFTEGLKGWTISPAEKGSIRADRRPGFGWLQGRYPPAPGEGDDVLVTRRCAARPNVVSQEIKGLEPGRLYSLRMFMGDFQDLDRRQELAVSMKLQGVSPVPGKTFTHVFSNTPSHGFGPYGTNKKSAWMNYHWRLFRADDTTAKLSICDWAGEDDPGGSLGQEIMYNYLSVQPYFAEAGSAE